ncbi:MAG: hypothetical protein LBR76_06905 [Oscillospiraceae bacterium]|nr:hypothetical protein [Oscillospiraceae bacterium]
MLTLKKLSKNNATIEETGHTSTIIVFVRGESVEQQCGNTQNNWNIHTGASMHHLLPYAAFLFDIGA